MQKKMASKEEAAASAPVGTAPSENGTSEDHDASTKLPNPSFSIPIHSLISTSQSTHGLPHGDHRQYRSYCTRKLSRLRRARPVRRDLSHSSQYAKKSSEVRKTKGGRHAFRPLDVSTDDAVRHVNHILVALYESERAWSHALEIKSIGEQQRRGVAGGGGGAASTLLADVGEKGRSSPGKIRCHALRRLNKATKHATDVEAMAKVAGDDRTQVEARAYACWMRGNWCLEVGDWQTACTEYGSALTICRALSSGDLKAAGGTASSSREEEGGNGSGEGAASAAEELELRDFFAARAEHVIEPLLRYCQYELQEGGMDQSEMLSFMKSQEDAETELLATSFQGQAQLQSKLDSIRDEKLRTQASGGSMSNVHFRSHDVPVENKSLRVALLKIADLKSVLEKEVQQKQQPQQQQRSKKGKGKGSNSDDAKFLALLSGYDDAISIVSADLKEYQEMKSGPAVNAKRFQAESLLGYVKHGKLKLLMNRNERMVDDLRGRDRAATTEDEDSRNKRVEEIAHLYDALLQDARAVAVLPGGRDGGEGGGEVEDEFVLEANANVLRVRALRCYYVARMYAADGVDKYAEAVALFEQANSLASEAAEEIAACQDMDDGEALVRSMVDLEVEIASAKCRAEACAYLARSVGRSLSSTSGRCLLRRLDDFDSGGKDYALADVPPPLQPIPCKPTFFDIALNHVGEYPVDTLQKHIDLHKQQSKGILSWFRRG